MWIEALGIVATLLVLLSFLFKDTKRIRIVNIFGAAVFVVYGALQGAISVWLLNGILILVHSVYLIREYKKK